MAGYALERVGLRGKSNRLPSEISGGEQERVAIARSIANEPPILLADEPTGNLDSKTSKGIMDLFEKLNVDGTTIVMVTHNRDCANYARRILEVSDGLLAQQEPQIWEVKFQVA
jgi:putative ABC transport system ATP-binding protein